MVFSAPFYARAWFGAVAAIPPAYGERDRLLAWFLMVLTTAALAVLGTPILTRFGASFLVLVGAVSAYAVSVAHTLAEHGSLYYDTAAMILVLVTLAESLEAGARRRAAVSATRLLPVMPARVETRRGAIDPETASPGDEIRARPGETIAVDGVVVEGTCLVDEAILTGESRPRAVRPGDKVLAGGVPLDGAIWVRAEKVGDARMLRHGERLLAEARLRPAPMERLADRAAAFFVPAVALLAGAVFARRAWGGDAAAGLLDALSVLLVACPCALGLAAPLALWTALRRAADAGILLGSAETLERSARLSCVFFDKTGTLTTGRPEFQRIGCRPGLTEPDALRFAAALESTARHPIAGALVRAARARGLQGAACDPRVLPGQGMEGTVDGRRLALGGDRLLEARGLPVPAVPAREDAIACGALRLFLVEGRTVLASFLLTETIRSDAAETMLALGRLGVEPAILSGDRAAAVESIARKLGLAAEGDLLPQDKVRRLEEARGTPGRRGGLAMVGDGVNDAAVLGAADVGIALGSAADLARQAADVHLVHDRLDRVPHLIALSRHAVRRVRFNLIWAFGSSGVGLALAAAGLLTPLFAASTMIASSLVLVALSHGAWPALGSPSRSAGTRL